MQIFEPTSTEDVFQLTNGFRHRRLVDMQDFRGAEPFFAAKPPRRLQVTALDTLVDHQDITTRL
jgi:hypothetical protein